MSFCTRIVHGAAESVEHTPVDVRADFFLERTIHEFGVLPLQVSYLLYAQKP